MSPDLRGSADILGCKDEAEARAAFEAAHSDLVVARRQMVVGWRAAELFDADGDDEELGDEADDGADAMADDEAGED